MHRFAEQRHHENRETQQVAQRQQPEGPGIGAEKPVNAVLQEQPGGQGQRQNGQAEQG